MIKVIYLFACRDVLRFPGTNVRILVSYNDLFIKRDFFCDFRDVDLSQFDIIVASPPCNYWTKANYRRDVSQYSLDSKHCLIDCIEIAKKIDKPMIIENVRNQPLFDKSFDCGELYVGYTSRHTFFANRPIDNVLSKLIDTPVMSRKRLQRQGGVEVSDTFQNFVLCYGTIGNDLAILCGFDNILNGGVL